MHTVIYHANAYVARDRFAQALWIEDGVIRQVGSDEEILAAAPADAQRIDAQGHTLVPGFRTISQRGPKCPPATHWTRSAQSIRCSLHGPAAM